MVHECKISSHDLIYLREQKFIYEAGYYDMKCTNGPLNVRFEIMIWYRANLREQKIYL